MALATASPVVRAEPPAPPSSANSEADQHFRQGVTLFKELSFAAALVEFRKAYAVVPNWRVLYDIGMTELELKDDAGAFTALSRYLREGTEIGDKRRSEVEALLQKLKPRVGTLRVSTNREGAEVTIDDVSVGKAPLGGPLVVNIGQRRVVATMPEGKQVSRVVDVAGQDDVAVELPFGQDETPARGELRPASPGTPETTAVVAPPLPPSGEPPPLHRPSYLWVGLTLTGALAAGGVVTGVLALKAKDDADADASRVGGDPGALPSANASKHTLAAVSDALFASAVVAGGVTLYFTLRHPGKGRASAAGPRPPAPRGVGAWTFALSPTGASLGAEF
jgi:hypothetical protein